MRHTGIHADDDVHALGDRSRIAEVTPLVAGIDDVGIRLERVLIWVAHVGLQAHVLKIRGQVLQQLLERDASKTVIGVRPAAAPHETDARFRTLPQPLPPRRDLGHRS